ncbi:MAG: acyltransferase family protein, partial [Kineosporiaceae bacterium]
MATRRSYLDLLRVVAIAAVVIGHWLLIDISYQGGRLSGHDALEAIRWAGWLTLPFQVMPVFFLVGGYVNAGSWLAHREGGGGWGTWVGARARRLLRPASVYLAVVVVAVVLAAAVRRRPDELAQAAWLVCLHLWFLPTYLLLIALTPVMLAAHRRWGLLVPAAMAVAAAMVDVGVLRAGLPLIGFANYLLVWGSIHQWGFTWRDRAPAVSPRRAALLATGGAALFGVLVLCGAFPPDLIGARNTSPPSIALLAFAAAQTGLVVLVEPAATRMLDRGNRGRRIAR